jgi:hypothetical protein
MIRNEHRDIHTNIILRKYFPFRLKNIVPGPAVEGAKYGCAYVTVVTGLSFLRHVSTIL